MKKQLHYYSLFMASLLCINLMFVNHSSAQISPGLNPGAQWNIVESKSVSSLCAASSVPYFEGFESGYSDQDTLFPCWRNVTSTGNGILWVANTSYGSYNRAPRTGLWNACLEEGGNSWLIRRFQLTGSTNYTFDIWARQDNIVDTYLEVKYGLDSTISGMLVSIIPTALVTNEHYQLFTGTFTPPATGTYYIGIHGDISSIPWYVSIDDISLYVTPLCLRPSVLTSDSLTTTSVKFGWTSSASKWQIQYGLEGFLMGTGTKIVTTTNPKKITGFTPNTNYELYVRSICGTGDTSIWAGPYYITTPCDNVSVFPLIEGFENEFPPECWSNYSVIGDGIWDTVHIGYDPDCMPHSGNAMARWNSYDISAGYNGLLITPALNIPNNGYVVRFWVYRDADYPTNDDLINIYYNTAPYLAGAVPIGTVHRNIAIPPIETITGWYSYQFPLPAGSLGNGRYVIFEGVSAWGYNMHVDDIYIGGPPCPNPSNLHIVSTTGTSATIDWTSGITTWKVQYGPTGFPLGSGTKITTTTKPYTIGGLTDGCYDYYVQAVCSVTDTSDWIGPKSFCICGTVYTPNYTQGFETALFPPVCWSNTVLNTNQFNTWYNETSGSYEGTKHAAIQPDLSSGAQDEWLYTPKFNLNGLSNPQLRFAWYGNKLTALPPQNKYDLNVLVSVNNGPYTQIWNESNTNIATWITGAWRKDSISLHQYIGTTVQFAFQYIGTNGSATGVDAVAVQELPPFFDIAVHQNSISLCDTLGWFTPPITVKNTGFETIPSGNSITCSYKVNAASWVTQTFTVPSNLISGDSTTFVFSTPYHFNQVITYSCAYGIHYVNDHIGTNDTSYFSLSFGAIIVNLGHDTTLCDNQNITLSTGGTFDTYAWSTGANGVSSITVDSTGLGIVPHIFWVQVTKGTCSDKDTIIITFSPCTGIQENENTSLNIYPNPSTGLFNLEISGFSGEISMHIFDLPGQLIRSETFINKNKAMLKQLDLALLPKGLYFLELRDNSHQTFSKLIIE